MDALARLSADPRYWDLITIPIQMHLAVSQENWLQLWWLIPINEWQHYQPGPALLAFFAPLRGLDLSRCSIHVLQSACLFPRWGYLTGLMRAVTRGALSEVCDLM